MSFYHRDIVWDMAVKDKCNPHGMKVRRKIIDTFLQLMREKKWEKINIKEICARADLSRSSFYNYFFDIHDLIDSIQNELIEDLSARYRAASSLQPSKNECFNLKKSTGIQTPAIFEVWFQFCLEHRTAMVALSDENNGIPDFRKKLENIVVASLSRMMDNDGLPCDSMRHYFEKMFYAMHFYSMHIWLSGDMEEMLTPRQMASMLNTIRAGAMYNTYVTYSSGKENLSSSTKEECL